MLEIRTEAAEDIETIHKLNEDAFGQPDEAKLVDLLRQAGGLRYSLIATVEGLIVGHLAISPVSIVGDKTTSSALGLAPMAVLPAHQRQGIGSEIIRFWLRSMAQPQDNLLVVLGHAGFYPRFGFVPAKPFDISCQYDVPEENFMVLELRPGALREIHGVVYYHEAFSSLS